MKPMIDVQQLHWNLTYGLVEFQTVHKRYFNSTEEEAEVKKLLLNSPILIFLSITEQLSEIYGLEKILEYSWVVILHHRLIHM